MAPTFVRGRGALDIGRTTPHNRDTATPTMLSPGSRVGRYVVREQLGAGGMGEVYSAHDPTLNRLVALKVVKAGAQLDKLDERFRREAWAASSLNHPNILTIYELGETNGTRFIASELVEGQTLRQILKARPGRLPFREVLDISQQIASALSAAHAAGIVHRDIKPENVMVRPDGYVKVLDFGLAKLAPTADLAHDTPTALMTAPGVLLGTVLYMAPEQVRGLPVDARADVWAFGCVLYEMVTGQSPFIGKTTADILAAVLDREPVAPVSLRTDVPTGLVAIIARALAKDPAERFQTMVDVGEALRAVGRGLDAQIVSGGHPELETAAVDAPSADASLPGATTDAKVGRSRRAMLTGLATVGIGVVLTAWALRGTGTEAPPASPATPIAVPPAQTLRVWLTVQKMQDGQPFQDEFLSSGAHVFGDGWKFRLNASSPDRAAFYVVNKGPGPGGSRTLHLLFPTPRINAGSALLTASVPMQTQWYVFTKDQGTENLWLVASHEPVPALEAVKSVVNPQDAGLISDEAQLSAIRTLFGRVSRPSVEKDDESEQTILRSSDPILVYLMKLKHD